MTALMLNLFRKKFQAKFQNDIILPSLTLQSTILRVNNEANNICNLLDHILLVFKYYIYRPREKHIVNVDILIDNLIEIKKKEKRISLASTIKTEAYNKKWCIRDNDLPVT